jgi:hypothetical protein
MAAAAGIFNPAEAQGGSIMMPAIKAKDFNFTSRSDAV